MEGGRVRCKAKGYISVVKELRANWKIAFRKDGWEQGQKDEREGKDDGRVGFS